MELVLFSRSKKRLLQGLVPLSVTGLFDFDKIAIFEPEPHKTAKNALCDLNLRHLVRALVIRYHYEHTPIQIYKKFTSKKIIIFR